MMTTQYTAYCQSVAVSTPFPQACYVSEQKLKEDDDPTSPDSVSATVNIEKYALPDGTRYVYPGDFIPPPCLCPCPALL